MNGLIQIRVSDRIDADEDLLGIEFDEERWRSDLDYAENILDTLKAHGRSLVDAFLEGH